MAEQPALRRAIESGEKFNNRSAQSAVAASTGGSVASGSHTTKEGYDLIEIAANHVIGGQPQRFDPTHGPARAKRVVKELLAMVENLPTQNVRDGESIAMQQFSTPPHYAYLVAWVANLSASDVVLEPSAGTGCLAIHAINAGCKVYANELSERRRTLLGSLTGITKIYGVNAEQLDNLLPAEIVPTVVLMNPPFSAAVNMPGKCMPAMTCQHIEQALLRLADGGRLVTIVGRGMSPDKPTFSGWWAGIKEKYTLRANIGIDGREYRKMGTSFDTRLICLDKAGPTVEEPVVADASDILHAMELLKNVRERRGESLRKVFKSPASVPGSLFDYLEVKDGGVANPGAGLQTAHKPKSLGTSPAVVSRGPVAFLPVRAIAHVSVAPITDAIYESYQPQRVTVDGAQPHPTPMVQSTAMASVLPPETTYAPCLPMELVTSGKLSMAQLEAIIYAGAAHEQFLPEIAVKVDEGKPTERMVNVTYRRGYMVGDAPGAGKGRQLCGIILDNFNRGNSRKALWLSKTPKLVRDAVRDWTDLGGRESEIINLGRIGGDDAITAESGILFCSYGLLKGKSRTQTRFKQIIDWLGDDFRGVIGLDESHVLRAGHSKKTKRGHSKVSDVAMKGIDLQNRLPNARVVYLSATAGNEVSNFAYATRLGLWGPRTSFPTRDEFINQMEAGGTAGLELLSRDMKQMGCFCSRSLSFQGVQYERLLHVLSPEQRQTYDKLCEAWQVVFQNFEAALEVVASYMKKDGGRAIDRKAKMQARIAFWGASQRFWNQVLCSSQMPTVIQDVEQSLADGHACVLQLVNTNEAAQERQLSKLMDEDGEGDLSDIDMTPRDQLMQLIEHSFPVVQHESFVNAGGKTEMRPLMQDGKPVINRHAVAMRNKLLMEISTIRCPDGPLEMLINHFGPTAVAEVTGRGRRVVRVKEDGIEKTVIESRSPAKCMAEASEFQDGNRLILVFSDAGGTGQSYHASLSCNNQRRRIHYLLQPGWVAAQAVQGFGRTHRSAQRIPPLYKLVTTDVLGHRRFISTVAKRLENLGAVTKGHRDAVGGMFSAEDNLEGEYGRAAMYQLFRDIYAGKVEGITLEDFEKQTGLSITEDAA